MQLYVLSGPRGGRQFGDAWMETSARPEGQLPGSLVQIVSSGGSFRHGENGRDLGSGLCAADVDPILSARAIGRIEFPPSCAQLQLRMVEEAGEFCQSARV